jgi:hypothetical protein
MTRSGRPGGAWRNWDRVGDIRIKLDYYQARVQPDPNSGCHTWTGLRNNIGYGLIGCYHLTDQKHKMVTPHRVALRLKLGREIAPGMNANHTCHNRLCVNPDHLYEGTQRQKIDDMVRDQVRFGGLEGRRTGPRNRKDANRVYKYSEAEIAWFRDATTDEIVERTGWTRNRASAFRTRMRTAYKWLPWSGKKYQR